MKKMGYEYLDHTADIQLHSWAGTLEEAMTEVIMAMFGYMTDLDTVDPKRNRSYEVSGHDLESLLFNLMDEFLFVFCTEYFIVRRVHIKELDLKTFRCRAEACGEEWQMGRHPQGTEIKAITYSNMQILYTKSDNDDSDGDQSRFDIYVIVDI